MPFTADQVRRKRERLREVEDAYESARVISTDEQEFGNVPVPKGEFVGFRMAFFDIETTNLGALMGRMLCASVADSWGNVTTRTISDFDQTTVLDDSGLAEWIRDELERYDIVVGWNSSQFDISFIQARLLRWGRRALRQDLMHIDPMYKARPGRGARIGSSKLDNVAKFFRTPDQKTALDWDTWNLAAAGDEAAMALVVEHCEADVLVLRSVFQNLKPLIRTVHR